MIVFRTQIIAFTCSIRLRTAKAGRGNPCAEVALCTPPEIGVLKSPALLPPLAPLPWGSTFLNLSKSFSLLLLWFESPFRTWEGPLILNQSSNLIYPTSIYVNQDKKRIPNSMIELHRYVAPTIFLEVPTHIWNPPVTWKNFNKIKHIGHWQQSSSYKAFKI